MPFKNPADLDHMREERRKACAWRIPIMSTNRPYFIDL